MRSQPVALLRTSLQCTKQWQKSQSSTRLYPCLFSTSSVSQSGHNRWSKIRHDKGANDKKRGSAFSKISQEISFASKSGGLDGNLRLTAAIAAAKKGLRFNPALRRTQQKLIILVIIQLECQRSVSRMP